ncbi:hypothetical protein [Campylobacter corcagiensis]|uniref:Transcriptional regulator n=1 Tax=Campylobacter corcagiensis TaxID=1448857 RepID=A0A7M1LHC9_9BACT|nr:hypothetical protein [Campylobacter corcagiensis]QKF64581.1 Mu phage-associated protein [Campylobacter corcagiensis]QOQ87246.1 hypothetical protein IMC76_08570 [Campylobacter corcagiensis]
MTLSEIFDKKCITPSKWFRNNNLDPDIGYRVLRGELTGERNTKGKTREVFEALLNDGFIDELPSGLRDNKKAS